MSGFNFGQPPSTTSGVTFGFGSAVSSTPAQKPAGLTFGAPQAPTTSSNTAPSFGFGQSAGGSSTGFGLSMPASTKPTVSFGGATTAPSAPAGGLSFGFSAAATAPSSVPAFGLPSSGGLGSSTGASGSLGFGFSAASTTAAAVSSAPGFSFSATSAAPAATAAPTSSFGGLAFGQGQVSSAAPLSTGLASFAKPAAISAAAPSLPTSSGSLPSKLPALSCSTPLPSFGAPATTGGYMLTSLLQSSAPPATTTPSLSFQLPSSTAATTQPATTTASASSQGVLNYHQLEELVTKWSLELEEQEKVFLEEAAKVNAWDCYLVENSDKIRGITEQVEKAKVEQIHVSQELDFITSQQRELEDALEPLERAVEALPPGHTHADRERQALFQTTETLDAELKQMMQEFREVVDYLNANSTLPSDDPMAQVTSILNAHLESLQWVNQNTQSLQKRLDTLSEEVKAKQSVML